MTTYNTGNPIGSTDPRDLHDNSQNLDQFLNAGVDTYEDRLGRDRLTVEGALKKGTPIAYGTQQDMDADASRPAGTWAVVVNDPDATNNGFYIRTATNWTRSTLQPASFPTATRNGYLIAGKLLSKVWDGVAGTWTISHSALRIFRGGARGLVNIPAASGVVVPQGRAYVADVTGALSGATVTPYVTADNAYGSTYQSSEFVADEKLVLFLTTGGEAPYTNTGILNNGALITADDLNATLNLELRAYPNAGRVWLKISASVSVSYDDSTRTLSWDGGLFSPVTIGTSTRVYMPAMSVTIPNANYQIVWIDLRRVPAGNADLPPDAIQVGGYNGSAANVFKGLPYQLPIFFRERAGVYGACSGFPYSAGGGGPPGQASGLEFSKGTNSATFHLLGTGSRKIELPFVRETVPYDGTSPNSQLDNWRIVGGWETSADYVRGNQIINTGEWEMALRLSGSTDSVGGYHGDELLHDALFLVDGVPLGQTATATRRSVREVQVLQNSYVFDQNVQAIYDPVTGLPTNAIAKHSKRYEFTPTGIRISQRLEWLQARTLVSAWVTMFPILRNRDNTTGPLITDTALRSRLFETEDVSMWDANAPLTYIPVSDGDSVSLWGATSGISGSVRFTRTPRLPNQKMYISTNTSAYNKVYFNLRGDSSAGDPEIVTTVGETWEWEAFYQVNTAN